MDISCGFYHGGMNPKERSFVQKNWMEEKIKVIIATIAFGMGINKRNVRYVIHDSMPKSLDSYI
jgi:superfamily II DNA helicase RecQ